MKKFSFLALLAAAGLAVGCSEELAENGNGSMEAKKIQVSFGVDIVSEDSRSEVDLVDGKVQGNWVVNTDQIGVYSNTADENTAVFNEPFTYGNKDNKFFNGELTKASVYTLQAYYPYGADYASGTTVTIPFGVERTQEGGKFNSAYDILLSEPATTEVLDGHTFDFVRPLSVLNFDTSAAGAFRYARLTDLDGGLLSTGGLTFEMGAAPTLAVADDTTNASTIWVDLGSETAHADVFFNVLPGNYNLKLDLLTEDGKISSTTIDRTNAEKPFEAGKFYYKKVSGEFVATAAPSVAWPNGEGGYFDMDASYEITLDEDGNLTYPAAINISAPAGIQSMYVLVDSEVIINDLGISVIPLVPENGMAGLLPGGPAYHYATEAVFDVTPFLPLIAGMVPESYGTHVFELYVYDGVGREAVQALTFTVTEPAGPELDPATATYNNDANYWTNTATFSLNNVTEDDVVKLQYRVKGTTNWKYASISAVSADYKATATIQAAWTQKTVNSQTVYDVDNTTGIFAGKDYEWQFIVDDVLCGSGTIEATATGDAITSATFEDSSLSCWGESNTAAPFWASGNCTTKIFSLSIQMVLCKQASYTGQQGSYSAHLTADYAGGMIGAGNLFTGTFDKYDTERGRASFGQKFTYTARPSALKFKHAVQVGTVDRTKHKLNGSYPIAKKSSDISNVYVCIVDWASRWDVESGTKAPTGFWDPSAGMYVNGNNAYKILAYGIMEFTQQDMPSSMQDGEIKLYWYDKEAAAPTNNYTIVIAASTSKYGDYMCGCDDNHMYLDNFEWVY